MREVALTTVLPQAAETSFDEIVRQREAQVLRTVYRILGNWPDAEDAAQDVFVRLHRHGLGFPTEAALGAWLYRVTVNLCLDRARAARRWQPLPELPHAASSVEAEVIREEQKRNLMWALARLPVKERAAVVLREIEGLCTAEVARLLGSTEGTVRSQVSRAPTHLRAILSEEDR